MKYNHHGNSYGNSYRNERQIRQDIRVPASFLAELVVNGQTIFGKLEDISLNGAKLRLSLSLPIKSKIALKLANHHLTLQGNCVWSSSQDLMANSYLAGVRFIDVNPQQYTGLRQILFNLAN
ncbi:MAG: PilZ domain-containing protein [Firmicutes bacterium]|nr:PilZ domain-containing protein [Bacillota bacterium]